MLAKNDANINRISVDENLSREDIIKGYLQEIEGDVYAFLHIDNLKQLEEDGLVSNEGLRLASELREVVLALPKKFWTVGAYEENTEWENIHSSAKAILNIL